MHELLLHAPVPSSRHHQVLSILAGLAAMQPIFLCEQVQLYKPNRQPEASRTVQVGAVQGVNVPKSQASQMQAAMAGDLFYLRVVRELKDGFGAVEEKGDVVAEETANGVHENEDGMDVDSDHHPNPPQHTTIAVPKQHPQPNPSQPPPTLQFRDVPEAGRQKDRAVTSRLMADIPITSGSPSSFMAALDYTPISIYYTEGHRLSYNNISLHLNRVLVPSTSSASPSAKSDTTGKINREELRLLDGSGAYILQASVRVQDGSKVEMVQRGVSELLGLRETLRGVVELEMVERLALDTRVR